MATYDIFGAPTGAGVDKPNGALAGSPEYEQNIVGRAARSLKPAYQSAMLGLDQAGASSGLLNSGVQETRRGMLGEHFLNRIGDTASGAATRSADIGEENRRATERRGWQVEDRDMQMEWLREQADSEERRAQAQQWADLIGGVAGAAGTVVGGVYGGAPGAALGAGAGQSLGNAMAPGESYGSNGNSSKPSLKGYTKQYYNPDMSMY